MSDSTNEGTTTPPTTNTSSQPPSISLDSMAPSITEMQMYEMKAKLQSEMSSQLDSLWIGMHQTLLNFAAFIKKKAISPGTQDTNLGVTRNLAATTPPKKHASGDDHGSADKDAAVVKWQQLLHGGMEGDGSHRRRRKTGGKKEGRDGSLKMTRLIR